MYFIAASKVPSLTKLSVGALVFASLTVASSTAVQAADSCPCFTKSQIVTICDQLKANVKENETFEYYDPLNSPRQAIFNCQVSSTRSGMVAFARFAADKIMMRVGDDLSICLLQRSKRNNETVYNKKTRLTQDQVNACAPIVVEVINEH